MYAYIYCVVFWLFNIILAIHDLNNTPGQHDCSDDLPLPPSEFGDVVLVSEHVGRLCSHTGRFLAH